MTILGTLGPAAVAGVLVAGVFTVPTAAAAESRSSAGSVSRTCTFKAPKSTTLRINLRLPLQSRGENNLRGVRVRATDNNGHGKFRNRRVNAGRVVISIENEQRSSGGGSIGSASAVRRNGSPAAWRLNPRSNGADVERVVAQVTFKIRNGPRVVATCAARP